MLIIQQITQDAFQKQNLILPDGSAVSLTIYFMPMQQTWVITNLTYQNFQINGLRISNQPNMLYQFKNQIPFGLACFSVGNREPSLQQDFESGASTLYLLTQAEVIAYSEILSGQIQP